MLFPVIPQTYCHHPESHRNRILFSTCAFISDENTFSAFPPATILAHGWSSESDYFSVAKQVEKVACCLPHEDQQCPKMPEVQIGQSRSGRDDVRT